MTVDRTDIQWHYEPRDLFEAPRANNKGCRFLDCLVEPASSFGRYRPGAGGDNARQGPLLDSRRPSTCSFETPFVSGWRRIIVAERRKCIVERRFTHVAVGLDEQQECVERGVVVEKRCDGERTEVGISLFMRLPTGDCQEFCVRGLA